MLTRLLCLLIVVVCLIRGIDAQINEDKLFEYMKLTMDVMNFYRASSIVNINTSGNRDFNTLTTMLHVSRSYSDSNILAQTVTLGRVHEYAKYYKYKIRLPLYVIALQTQLDLEELSNFTKTYSMNLWLVFINGSPELLQFCQAPDRNLFNMSFDTRVLIKCKNDPVIKEWYSIRQHEVKVNSVARWTINEGFVMVNSYSMFKRRNSLDNITIRIGTVKQYSLVASQNENHDGLNGFFGSILRELTAILNFTTEVVSTEDVDGSFIAETGNWSGVMGKLVSKEIDMGVLECVQTKARMDVVDFTVPVSLTRTTLYLKKPQTSCVPWTIYSEVLDRRLWILNVIVIIICSFVIALMMVKLKKRKMIPLAGENFFNIWGIVCQQSLAKFPSSYSLKLAFMSIVVPSTIIYMNYSAVLTSYLAVVSSKLPFTNEQEFLAEKSFKLIVLRNSVYDDYLKRSNNSISQKMHQRLKRSEDLPINMIEAINQVCNERVVLCTNQLISNEMNIDFPCSLMTINTGPQISISFALVKHSPYRRLLNYYIENFHSYGILKVLKNRHMKKETSSTSIYTPVSFWSAVPILVLFLSGAMIAVIIFICEHVNWYLMKSSKGMKKIIKDKFVQLEND